MTLIASLLFLTALAASVLTFAFTVRDSLPRISEVIEGEFMQAKPIDRRIYYGAVKRLRALGSAEIAVFPVTIRAKTEFKLAA